MMKSASRKIIWLFAVAILSVQGCSHKPANPSGSRAEQEADIQEAVLLHLIAPSSSNKSSPIFISVNRSDPTPQFLQRFAKHQLNVKPESQSSWANGRVIDSSTGLGSVIYDVRQMKWTDAQSVEVYGGWISANLSAMTCEYLVIWDGNKWRVKENGTCAIS